MSAEARLVVVSPSELADGFRLTGAVVSRAGSPEEAGRVISGLLADGERGVIAVYAPLFEGLDDDFQRRLRASVSPVVVELPTGMGSEPEASRRSRLARRLERAIGYHISFGEDEA